MEEAGLYNISLEQGSGFTLPITYEAPEGQLVDFTGSTARLQARAKYSSPNALFSLTTENGGITARQRSPHFTHKKRRGSLWI